MSDSRTHVQQRIREVLQQQVLSGKWHVGERLPSERQLALEFAASRATVREAIQFLVAQGLLVCRQGSGVYLQPPPTPAPVSPAAPMRGLQAPVDQPLWRADMLEYRLMFECGAARLAALRADAGQRAALGQLIERMQSAVAARDVDAEAMADAEFHELLAAAAHNLMIRQYHAAITQTLRQHITHNTYAASRRRSTHSQQHCLARMQQHINIYQAIMDRLPEQAETAMRIHLQFVGAQFTARPPSDIHGLLDVYRRPQDQH